MRSCAIFALPAAAAAATAADSFVIYNDVVPTVGDVDTATTSRCSYNRYTHGRHVAADAQLAADAPQELIDSEGQASKVTLQYSEKTTHDRFTINNSKNKIKVKRGSAAWEEFGECLCDEADCDPETDECTCEALDGNLSYNDAPGWNFRYSIEGLNPECRVDLVFFVERSPTQRDQELSNSNYENRYSMFSLEKAKEFDAVKCKATAVLDDGKTLVLRSGQNSEGHVAKWVDVQHDGSLDVVVTHGNAALAELGVQPPPHEFMGYAGGVFKIEQRCDAPANVVVASEQSDSLALPLIVGGALAALMAGAGFCAMRYHRAKFQEAGAKCTENPAVLDVEVADKAGTTELESASTATPDNLSDGISAVPSDHGMESQPVECNPEPNPAETNMSV